MDAHISVIEDFKTANPDIEVIDWTLSSHCWVMNKKISNPKFINEYTWHYLNEEMIRNFQNEYNSFLEQFDGFITCHVSAFAMIYEKYNKPILMINSCRYDLPFCRATHDMFMYKKYHECIERIKDRLIIVSNNKGDQEYTYIGTGIKPFYNPSLCLYINVKYSPTKDTFLCHSRKTPDHPLITQRHELGDKHEWKDVMSFRGIIHVPYEISTMSMFEHFTAGCPLFFPSKTFLKSNPSELITSNHYWNNNYPEHMKKFSDLNIWIDLSDMYHVFQSPNTYYYDSMEHLYMLLESFQYIDDMKEREIYIERVKENWKIILNKLFKN